MLLLITPVRSAKRSANPTACWRPTELAVGAPAQVAVNSPRLLEQDRMTCEKLATQHGARLLSIARRMLRSEEDAADAVQDALLAALKSIHRFRAEAQISTWLHRIVSNVCLMKLRSRKRRETISLDSLPPVFDSSSCHVGAIDPWTDQACEQVAGKELCQLVRECIDRLPENYRAILILRDLEELSTDQTAAILGLSHSATKTRLHRARQALRTLLAPTITDHQQ